MPVSREKFFIGHSLASNKLPAKLPIKALSKIKESNVDLKNFGLFDTATPNFNTYYPDLKPEDLVPNDKDYVNPVFRALSQIIINKYGPIDFSQDNVLKKSRNKLVGQTIYTNHEASIGNEVGVITEVMWVEAQKQGKINIPAGINARLKIDGKSNPKLARGVMSDPPSVHSVSVTITFRWEKSHPEMSDEDFWQKLGSYDKENSLITRTVVEIMSYEEISLVSHGADPYAQKINEAGGIVNPAYADNQYQFSAEEFSTMQHHFDWKEQLIGKVKLSKKGTIPKSSKLSNNKKTNSKLNEEPMNKELLKFLRAQFGLADSATEADVTAKLQERLPIALKAETDITGVQTKLTSSEAALAAAKVITPEQILLLEAAPGYKLTADAALAVLRADTLKQYHLSVGGAEKADAAMATLIAGCSYEVGKALLTQYTATAESKFTAKCGACGSTNISRASASQGPTGVQQEGNSGGSDNPPAVKETADVIEQLSKRNNSTAGIHGELIKDK